MAKRTTKKPTKKVDIEVLPTQVSETINCTINSSYTIDSPDIMEFTTTILLNNKQIENEITNTKGIYKGITLIKKSNKVIIHTGKHGLSTAEEVTSGVLTLKFMEI